MQYFFVEMQYFTYSKDTGVRIYVYIMLLNVKTEYLKYTVNLQVFK